jgi:ribulose-5-phosphate 4-epimerase/fuculose-1-phosphate aldolase
MMTAPARSIAGMRDRVSPIEWETRVKLAAAHRLMAADGIADLTYNHLSARIPDHPDRYLIKAERELFDEVTASSLLTYNFAGERIYESEESVGRAGLVIHGGVLEARPDVMAVFHTHTPANIAVSAQSFGLLPISQHAMRFGGNIGYHDFTGFEFDLDGRTGLVRDLDGKLMLVLRNHGVLACGRSIPEAYINHHAFEMAARAQVGALSAGGGIEHLVIPSDDVLRHAAEQASKRGHRDEHHRDWGALIRLAERLDPSYRT